MKRLTLVRHAKTDPALAGQQDWERTLTRRGELDAADMAHRLKTRKLKPDLLLVSTAERARATAAIFIKEFGLASSKTQFDERLYLADPKHLLEVVHELGGDEKHLMIIGHNPGICEFADRLCKDEHIEAMPTCAVFTAKFKLEGWDRLEWHSAAETELDYPHKGL